MSEPEQGAPLVVPEQAMVELDAWTNSALAESDKRRAVVDIAAPVVAAELRRLAAYPTRDLDALLYDRADEVEIK